MPVIQRSALVPYPASAMFDLVSDIDAYPDFLPWCGGAQVLESSDQHQVATVSVSKSLKQTEFTTRNRLVRPERMDMRLVDGPFKRLEGQWRFVPIGEKACRCELEVSFEFASRMFSVMMGPAFRRVCDSLVDAFTGRAHEVLGPGGAPP